MVKEDFGSGFTFLHIITYLGQGRSKPEVCPLFVGQSGHEAEFWNEEDRSSLSAPSLPVFGSADQQRLRRVADNAVVPLLNTLLFSLSKKFIILLSFRLILSSTLLPKNLTCSVFGA